MENSEENITQCRHSRCTVISGVVTLLFALLGAIDKNAAPELKIMFVETLPDT